VQRRARTLATASVTTAVRVRSIPSAMLALTARIAALARPGHALLCRLPQLPVMHTLPQLLLPIVCWAFFAAASGREALRHSPFGHWRVARLTDVLCDRFSHLVHAALMLPQRMAVSNLMARARHQY